MSANEILQWLEPLVGSIEGITCSGGETFEQDVTEVAALLLAIRIKWPRLSTGVFSGYSSSELALGHFKSLPGFEDHWRIRAWEFIRRALDFAVLGRYNDQLKCSDPLVTSRNQKLVLYSDRYKLSDFRPQEVEITIGDEGLVNITGFPIHGSLV